MTDRFTHNFAQSHVAGILLAGGQSRRMGGGDKGLLEVAGRTMLHVVIERFAPQVSALAINANGDASRFREFGLTVVPDCVEGHAGPLAGVLAGMRWAAVHMPNAAWVATASCDAPFLPEDLVSRLHDVAAGQPDGIAMARSDGRLHPVIALWPVHLSDDLEAALRDDVRKVLRWTDRHGTLPVDFDLAEIGGKRIDPFFNANTPDEFAFVRDVLKD